MGPRLNPRKYRTFVAFFMIIFLITGCVPQVDPDFKVIKEQYKYDNNGRLISKTAPDGVKHITGIINLGYWVVSNIRTVGCITNTIKTETESG